MGFDKCALLERDLTKTAFFERNFIASFSFSVRNKLRSLIRWPFGNFIASFSFSKNVGTFLGTPFESGGVKMGPETVPRSRAALPARSAWY